jgi:hypothetical protein
MYLMQFFLATSGSLDFELYAVGCSSKEVEMTNTGNQRTGQPSRNMILSWMSLKMERAPERRLGELGELWTSCEC